MKISLKYKFLFVIAAVFLISGIGLFYTIEKEITRSFESKLLIKGYSTVENIETSCLDGITNEDLFGSLTKFIESSIQDPEILELSILKLDYSIIASNKKEVDDSTFYKIHAVNSNYIKDETSCFDIMKPIYAISEISDDREIVANVFIKLDKTLIQNEISVIISSTIVVIFGILLLSCVLILLFSNRLIKPIILLTKSSKEIESGNYTSAVEIQSNDEIGVLASSFEIMRRKINEQMKQAITLKDEAIEMAKHKESFLANMSHEIRTPMNGIVGVVDLLGQMEGLNPEQKKYVDIIQSSSGLLLTIINDILDLSKMESGKMKLVESNVDIKKLVRETVSLYRTKSVRKGIEILVDFKNDFPEQIIIDPHRLKQVLGNLISNAVKFTDIGQVKIVLSKVEGKLKFEVTDTGLGMREENISTLFEAFSQLDLSSIKQYQGTGLGLTISQNIATLFNSRIEVSSEFGKGSSFWFVIKDKPVLLNDGKEVEINTIKHSKIKQRNNEVNVLLVDDKKVNLIVASAMLKKLSCKVVTACDGIDAIKKARSKQFDLILMDIQMPDMDGVEAMDTLKSHENFDVPIIALTANAMAGDREKYIECGFDDYLPKPVTLKTLETVLGKWFE